MKRNIPMLELKSAMAASKLHSLNLKKANPEHFPEMLKHLINRCVHFGLEDSARVPFYEKRNGISFCEACNCVIAKPKEYDSNKESIMKAISVIDMLIAVFTIEGRDYDEIDNLVNCKVLLYEAALPYLDAVRDYYKEAEK